MSDLILRVEEILIHVSDKKVAARLVVEMVRGYELDRARSKWRGQKQASRARLHSADSQRTGGIDPLISSGIQIRDQSSLSADSQRKSVDYSEAFLAFWALYPRRTQKGAAWKAWQKAARANGGEDELVERVRNAIAWQSKQRDWTKDGGTFVPYPASYLSARGWEDEKPASNGRSDDGYQYSTLPRL